MANTDFGILLKTLLDTSGINSELEQVQKIVNKYSIDIMPELKTASLRNQMKAVSQEIANDFNKAFGTNLTGNDVFKAFESQAKQAEKAIKDQAKAAETARKEQEALNERIRQGQELAKKQANESFTSKQAGIYKEIIKNQEQIYALKKKLLSADELETEEINKQIHSLEVKNKYNRDYKLANNGMIDSSWDKIVQESKEVLESQYKIADTRKQDNANAKESARIAKETAQAEKERLATLEKQRVATANSAKEKAKSNARQELAQQKEINAILSRQESAYKEIWNINKQIATLDPTKNSDQISALNEKKKFYQETYLSAQKELQAYNNITVSQEHLVSLAEIRKKAESEIGVAVAKQNEALAKAQAESLDKIQLLSNGGIKNDYATQIAKLEGNFRSLGMVQDTINSKTQNVKNSLATLRAEFAKPVDQQNFQVIQTANDNLQRELIESTNEFERLRASMKGMATEQQRLSLANTIEAWNQKNTAATRAVVDENHRYILTLRDLNTQVSQMQLAQMNTAFKQNENSMRALNKLGASLKVQFKQAAQSFTMWLSASTAVMRVISETREAYNQLKEVNTILTEISKTNHALTSSDLIKIADNGFDVASKYGKTVTDYLSGVKDMSRAGYRNAEAMGELSTAVQGAGDMTADVANKMIIATDKAYKLGGSVEELTKILDGMNWISDNNAVNMTELSEGMSIVGSTAASFGVEVNELTAALATMAATTQQSGSEVARAFRAILLNIRQVSDEEEGIDAEGLTKYEKACNALGVSLKETVNGVLQTRDAMEVLEDLSIAYNKLDANDLRRTNLLNSVGGKLRSTQLDALLRQFDSYKSMLQQFEDGTGTMAFEADKTAKSWEGSLNRLKNTWADTIENIANSDGIIAIINGFEKIISGANKLTDTLGSLGSIGLGVGLFAGIKNVGQAQMWACLIYAYPC